jgi:hypothetical protein
LDFPVNTIDTLRYFPSFETDTEGLFEGSTCAFLTRDGFVMHLLITDESVKLIGVQGQLPFSGGIMNLVFTDTLVMTTFPCEFEDVQTDIGDGFDNQPISLFESIIPADTYSTLAAIFDTVRFKMDLNINSQFDEYGNMQFVGDSNLNGTFPYLRENRALINKFDVQLRNKFGGSYTSIGDIPSIADQLPMAIPMIDTAFSYSYWAKDQKNPLAEIALSSNYDSVYNVTFRYAYLSGVNSIQLVNHRVFPNPSADYVNFYVENKSDCTLSIFNSVGNLIDTQAIKSETTKLDISKFSSGNYLYQIVDEKGVLIARGKFVKTK